MGVVARDVRRAADLLERAAAQDHAHATYRLGRLLFVGDKDGGVPRDHGRALALLQRASELGIAEAQLLVKDAAAQFALGRMFEEGLSPPPPPPPPPSSSSTSASLFSPSFSSSSSASGPAARDAPARSYAKALAAYRRAASDGHAEAQYRMGLLLQEGLGTERAQRDPQAALRCFQRAAHQGLAEAQHHLGLLYYHGGKLVPRDLARARGT